MSPPENKRKGLYARLIGYAAPYKWRILVSMLASLLVGGSDALIAYLVKPFIDELIVAGNYALARWVPILIVVLAAAKGTGRFLQMYQIRYAGQGAIQDIRNDLYGHLVRLSMPFFVRNSSGTLMSRVLNDVNLVQSVLSDVLVTLLRESTSMIALICYAFYADWKMALMAFVVIPASAGPAAAIGRRIKKVTRKGQGALGEVTKSLEQTLSGIKVIKAFGTEKVEEEAFRRENAGFFRLICKNFRYDAASAPMIEIMTSLGVAVVLWYGLQRIGAGEMTKGELFSILAAIVMMYSPLKRLTRVNNVLQQALGAAERVFELFDTRPEIVDSDEAEDLPAVKGEVVFDRVTFAYEDEPVLREFSLKVAQGKVVALVGPSGAGKSTLISLINRFYDPTDGKIMIDGHDISRVTQESLHRQLSLVDQETFLFHRSIADNIRYGRPEASDEEVIEAASKACADEFIRQLPDGYRTQIGDRGVRLSGGQRQRICIARAILRDAPILLLDEATSALDTESEALVQQALNNLMQGRTTFVIAHRLSTIMHADIIAVLDQGRLVEQGTHTELLAAGGLYRRLYDMQFRDDNA
ncbi:MAG: lipid A export permease/ATP-binding protein MsbA [Deltaproteobacteria bacterium]|nr:MAG: lipid A export permease/ATP-binding protein MsbA [Deltaproteobacteria bacterium]